MQNNRISLLGPDTFIGATNLETIDLSYNTLRSLHKDIFRSVQNLEHLDLSHNLLETLDETMFLNNTVLSSLDLSYNRIKALSIKMFKPLPFDYLDMHGNVCVDAKVRGYLNGRWINVSYEIILAECNKNYFKKKVCHRIIRSRTDAEA
jgi:hypothetical protein